MMLLYIIFIISVILLGSVFVGPFSIRVYATVVMVAFLIFNYKKAKRKLPNSFIYLYIAFIVFMGVAMVMNGELNEFGYIKTIFAYHFVSIVAYYATGFFNTSTKHVNITISVLVAIMLVTSIVTILQYFNHPAGWFIGNMFGELDVSHKERIENIDDILLNSSLAYGIMGLSFTNAMNISVLGILSFNNIVKSKKYITRIFSITVCFTGLIACFMTQQRSAFFMMLVAYIICLFVCFRKKFVLVTLVIILVMYFSVDMKTLFSEDNVGRLSIENAKLDDTRNKLWSDALDFIAENPLWGGPIAYASLNDGLASHNFFFNAFIYGGLLGGIAVIVLFFKIIVFTVRRLVSLRNLRQTQTFCIVALLIYLFHGLFHNESLVTGSVILMILLALSISTDNTDCRN